MAAPTPGAETMHELADRIVEEGDLPDGGEIIGIPDHACPKCGKSLNARGRHFHIRACKG